MADTKSDNSPGDKPKYPTVRLRTLPKKPVDPPPGKPAVQPQEPGNNRPEVRLRKLTPTRPVLDPLPASAPPPQESTPVFVEEEQVDPVWTADPEPLQESENSGTEAETEANMPVPQEQEPVRIRKLAKPAAADAPSKAYQPDTDLENIYRRQWWKYDLRVKSKRIQPAEAKGQE